MADRKRTPTPVEVAVLTKSRRRCCLCFGLARIDQPVAGQIAHLDQDRSNANEHNLAWLCLPHHDMYDSTTSQSKGFTEEEVRHWRTVLYEAMTREPPLTSDELSRIEIGDNNQHIIIGSGNTVNVGHPPSLQPRQKSAPLTDCEKRLLVQASSNDYGTILLTQGTGAYRLNSAGRDIFNGPPGRELTRWTEALKSLVERRYVEQQQNEFEYRLSGPGFDCADNLKSEDPVYSLPGEGIRILREAVKTSGAFIHFVYWDGGFDIKAGDHEFDFGGDADLAATWKAGFDQLKQRNFIEPTHQDSRFQVTKLGHEALKLINAVRP